MDNAFKATLKALGDAVTDDMIKQRKNGRDDVDYIEWHTAVEALNEHAPGWKWEIFNLVVLDQFVWCQGQITIGDVVRQGIGVGQIAGTNGSNFNTGVKKAEHDALKRAALKFGIGLQLYKDDDPQTGNPRNRDSFERAARRDEDVTDSPGQATAKQLAAIAAICKRLNKDPEKGAQYYFQTTLGKLTRSQASEMIKELEKKQEAAAKA